MDSNPGYSVLVLIHELMHSFESSKGPPEMMYPVVSYVAGKVADALGGAAAASAQDERMRWDAAFKRADPIGKSIDVTNDAVFDRRVS